MLILWPKWLTRVVRSLVCIPDFSVYHLTVLGNDINLAFREDNTLRVFLWTDLDNQESHKSKNEKDIQAGQMHRNLGT